MLKILWVAFFFLISCSLGPGNFQSRHSTDLNQRGIKRIAIMIPMPPLGEPKQTIPYAPATPQPSTSAEKQAPEILSRLLYSVMRGFSNWQIVSESEIMEVARELPASADVAGAKAIGRMVYADAVLVSRIIRYRERVGDDWGVKSPASAGFVLDLWDVRRGDLVWSGRYEETQKPLSENIFALGAVRERGVKWLTVQELAHEGLKKAISQLHLALYQRSA